MVKYHIILKITVHNNRLQLVAAAAAIDGSALGNAMQPCDDGNTELYSGLPRGPRDGGWGWGGMVILTNITPPLSATLTNFVNITK